MADKVEQLAAAIEKVEAALRLSRQMTAQLTEAAERLHREQREAQLKRGG